MVHFSEYCGRVEEIFLPEDGPTELGASPPSPTRNGGAGGDGGSLPTGAGALGGLVMGREWGGGVRGGVEVGTELSREEGPHGILSAKAM